MAYKGASKKSQAKLRRPIPANLPSFYSDLTDEQKRECLKQKVVSLEKELLAEKDKWRRYDLGVLKHDLCLQMNKLRPKMKAKGVANFFIEAAKEKLTLSMYNIIMDSAVQKLKEQQEKLTTPNPKAE